MAFPHIIDCRYRSTGLLELRNISCVFAAIYPDLSYLTMLRLSAAVFVALVTS